MSQKMPETPDPDRTNFLYSVVNQLRLVWLLLRDGRVPMMTKSIVPLSLLYLISPVDFVPDVILGTGQLDDLGVLLLGAALFVKLSPPEIVQHYRNLLEYGDLPADDTETIDSTYRVIDEDEESEGL